MVALKQRIAGVSATIAVTKQERRGGIETDLNLLLFGKRQRSRNAVVALKLVQTTPVNSFPITEAGTPWWH